MKKYDVVIIGAGIGGLTCGCYLAKAGLKVLIVEQHNKPGGYCTSFERNGYGFDVGMHYLGGVKRGILGRILEELEVKDEIKFNQLDPTDKIIMPDNIVYIRANPYDTIKEFKKKFPKEKENIERFFKFMMQKDFLGIYNKIEKITCREVLDSFFKDNKLKSVLKVLLINSFSCLNTDKVSGLALATLLREFILDPGYYPIGGIQKLPNTLIDNFKNYGGEQILSKKVVKIIVKNKKVEGVLLGSGEKFKVKKVVSNCDATMTFKELVDIETPEAKIVEKLIPSSSAFIVYLGINQNLGNITKELCNVWYFHTYDIEKFPILLEEEMITKRIFTMIASFPSRHEFTSASKNKTVLELFSVAPYKSKEFWKKNKEVFSEAMITKAEELLFPFRKYIDVKIIATPNTFHRYTLNKKGAMIGWIPTINQIKTHIMPQRTSLDGLFLVGHWCTIGTAQGGIPGVAFSGRSGARLILKEIGRMGFCED